MSSRKNNGRKAVAILLGCLYLAAAIVSYFKLKYTTKEEKMHAAKNLGEQILMILLLLMISLYLLNHNHRTIGMLVILAPILFIAYIFIFAYLYTRHNKGGGYMP